jgi:hypothetical protein
MAQQQQQQQEMEHEEVGRFRFRVLAGSVLQPQTVEDVERLHADQGNWRFAVPQILLNMLASCHCAYVHFVRDSQLERYSGGSAAELFKNKYYYQDDKLYVYIYQPDSNIRQPQDISRFFKIQKCVHPLTSSNNHSVVLSVKLKFSMPHDIRELLPHALPFFDITERARLWKLFQSCRIITVNLVPVSTSSGVNSCYVSPTSFSGLHFVKFDDSFRDHKYFHISIVRITYPWHQQQQQQLTQAPTVSAATSSTSNI